MNYKRLLLVLLGLAGWMGASFGMFALLYYPAKHHQLGMTITLGLILGAMIAIFVPIVAGGIYWGGKEGWAWLHGGKDV